MNDHANGHERVEAPRQRCVAHIFEKDHKLGSDQSDDFAVDDEHGVIVVEQCLNTKLSVQEHSEKQMRGSYLIRGALRGVEQEEEGRQYHADALIDVHHANVMKNQRKEANKGGNDASGRYDAIKKRNKRYLQG